MADNILMFLYKVYYEKTQYDIKPYFVYVTTVKQSFGAAQEVAESIVTGLITKIEYVGETHTQIKEKRKINVNQ